jgi:hypothetical protein
MRGNGSFTFSWKGRDLETYQGKRDFDRDMAEFKYAW